MKAIVLYEQRRGFFILLLCFFLSEIKSQTINNLVNNYSGEQVTGCPNISLINGNPVYWFRANFNGSPDPYNVCSGSVPNNFYGKQNPRTGVAYFGLQLYLMTFEGREDIETSLKQTLQNGKIYCVTFYANLAEFSTFALSNIGVYFTKDSLKNYWPVVPPTNFFFTPHVENPNSNIITDTTNWIQVRGTYTANGTENFITLTDFRNDANTNLLQVKPLVSPASNNGAYYYIDDVSVVEINPANAHLKDTVFICPTNTLVLGRDSTWESTYSWQQTGAGSSLSCTNCPNPVASPTVTTKYYLTKQQCSATTRDSVLVIVITPTTQANAGPDKNICPGEIMRLGTADSTNFVSYSWQSSVNTWQCATSCSNCAMPFVSPNVTTTYTIQRTECNVSTTDSVKITVDYCDILIPTVFTPNADGVNDVWKFRLPTGAKLNELNIYNRWGLLMYSVNSEQLILKSETTTLNIIWDGYTTAGIGCNEGVYFYTLSYTDKKGESKTLKGYISLFK